MPPRICPECGHDLVYKHGAYGQFIGCSNYPVCKFTMNEDGSPTKFKKEVAEWDEHGKPTSYGYSIQTKRKSPCSICKGRGLLPFIKNGKVIPNAYLICSCKEETDHYQPVKIEDFDYPMSDAFRGYAYQYCSQPDPGYIPPEPEAPKPQIVEHLHFNVPQQGYVRYLENKITEKQQRKPKPSGYKGIK